MKALPASSLAIAALVGVVALTTLVEEHRPTPVEGSAGGNLLVTSADDSGPGSLRDALFAAARSPHRVRIVVMTPTVVVRRPLPPLVHPLGITLVGHRNPRLDGSALGEAPLLDIDAPDSVLEGLTLVGRDGEAIRVRSAGVRLLDLVIENEAVGIQALGGAAGLSVENCRLSGNIVGIRVAPDALPVTITGCHFGGHRESALWAVGPDRVTPGGGRLTARGNDFARDQIGVVAGNVDAEIVGNTFTAPARAAIQLFGSGVRVIDNHLDGARQIGIVAEQTTESTLVEGNEIRATAAIGILTRAARGTTVRNNRLFLNGYGIADILGDPLQPVVIVDNLLMSQSSAAFVVIGSSPVLRGNRVVRNRGAAVSSLTLVDALGAQTASAARLVDNQFEGNGTDGVVAGVYRVQPEPDSTADPEPGGDGAEGPNR